MLQLRLLDERGKVVDDLLTMDQVMQILELSRTRVRQLVMEDVFRAHRIGERCYLLERRQVEAYAASYRKPGPKPSTA